MSVSFASRLRNAATVGLTLEQSTNVAGAGAKAVTALVPIWADLDAATSDALVRAADAASYTTDAAVKRKVVVFEIVPEAALDIAGGFDCIVVKTGASNVANITAAMYIAIPRYQQATPPSIIVD